MGEPKLYVVTRSNQEIHTVTNYYAQTFAMTHPDDYKIFHSLTEAEIFVMTHLLEKGKAWTEYPADTAAGKPSTST